MLNRAEVRALPNLRTLTLIAQSLHSGGFEPSMNFPLQLSSVPKPSERNAFLLQTHASAEPVETQVGVELRFCGRKMFEKRHLKPSKAVGCSDIASACSTHLLNKQNLMMTMTFSTSSPLASSVFLPTLPIPRRQCSFADPWTIRTIRVSRRCCRWRQRRLRLDC